MRYQFNAENRAGATTIVFKDHRVSFAPGIGELDDAVWNDIKDEPTIADLLATETLRVLTPSATPADPTPTTKTTSKKADAAAS